MSRMHVYQVSPIDDWSGWMTEDQYVLSNREQDRHFDETTILDDLRGKTRRAEYLAQKLGWEGDCTVGPLYSGIPEAGASKRSELLVGWRQSNDGTTYIASPYPLPWLDPDARVQVG